MKNMFKEFLSNFKEYIDLYYLKDYVDGVTETQFGAKGEVSWKDV